MNVQVIRIRFSEDVSMPATALAVRGVRAKLYRTLAFSYDAATFTATWTLARPIRGDKILLDLADTIADASGNFLDGEWTNPATVDSPSSASFPSGDGTEGGRFRFRFNVLAGDVNQSGRVTAADAAAVRSLIALGAYDPLADVNGDGLVDRRDLRAVLAYRGRTLPAAEPAIP
jgi:hypothetical protein